MNLTLPGLGGGSAPPPPPPPAAPPAPPTQAQASQSIAQQGRRGGRKTDENIRNEGGARGISTQGTQRALKSLTGQ